MSNDLEALPLDQRLAMKTARDRLRIEFGEVLQDETITQLLEASYGAVESHASITHHLPLLAERFARSALSTLAQIKQAPEGARTVVFLDHHDAGRAKMAKQLLLGSVARGSVVVATAGTSPVTEIEPAILRAMAEAGISLGQSFPKPLVGGWLRHADHVVVLRTTGLPELPDDVEYEHWEIHGLDDESVEEVSRLEAYLLPHITDLAQRLGLPPAN